MSDSTRFMIDAGCADWMSITIDALGQVPIFDRSVSGCIHGQSHRRSNARRMTLRDWMREASDILTPGIYTGTLSITDPDQDHEITLRLHGQRESSLTMNSDQSVIAITDYEEGAP